MQDESCIDCGRVLGGSRYWVHDGTRYRGPLCPRCRDRAEAGQSHEQPALALAAIIDLAEWRRRRQRQGANAR
jgi:hypothetical protein